MTENLYEQLRQLLDTHPVGCLATPEINEILSILFTEDEARAALGLGFMPFTIEQIAHRAMMEPSETEIHLEALANKGLVFVHEKKGKKRYALLNSIQIFENPYRKGVHDQTIQKLTPLWKKHRSALLPTFGSATASILRVIPIQKKIKAGATVLSYENVYEMIEKAEVLGISRCVCREFEQNCDASREACMHFGATSTFLVERGFGRYLSKQEMKQKLNEFDEMGLVRQVNNTSDRLEFICHCCSCCCAFFKSLKDYNNLRAVTRSAFMPVRNLENCVGCGTCANERCPTNAGEMINEKPVLISEKCIGCGLCATGCPHDAIAMERAVDIPEPPSNYVDLGMRLLQEQGKLEKFIVVNTPNI